MKILIADNSEGDNGRLSKLLEEEGHESFFVTDAAQIVDIVYQEVPDVVMLSLFLPGGDPLKILARLKTAPSTRDIPVVILTHKRLIRKLRLCYKKGACDYILKPYLLEEVKAKLQNIALPLQTIKELHGTIERDFLTGLYNRKFFLDRFLEELAWAIGYHESISVMLLDIDHFKKVNDTYGHSCGDEVLKQLAAIIVSHKSDTTVFARYGGEEFAALLINTDREQGLAKAEALRAAVEENIFVDTQQDLHLRLTASIGLTTYRGLEHTTVDKLLQEADIALYQAKAQGRNRVVGFASQGEEHRPS